MTDAAPPALQPWLPGTSESRAFTVRGHAFRLSRAGAPSFGFLGGGRDGDVVADDAPQPAILAEVIAGIAGVRHVYGPDYAADTPAAVDAVERALLAAAGRYDYVHRGSPSSRAVAEQLLALPRPPGTRREVSLRGARVLEVRLAEGAVDAVAHLWAWGRDPGDWLEATLRALGVEPERLGGSDVGRELRVPGDALAPLLARALDHLGWGDVRLVDWWG